MTEGGSFFKGLLRFRKLVAFFAAVIVFFFSYNAFLVDHTIEDLRFSLEQTAMAYDVKDLDGIDLLLSQFLVDEVLPENIDAVNVGNLEYARNAISGEKSYKVISSVQTSLNVVIKDKEGRRGILFRILDFVNRLLKKIKHFLTSPLAKIFPGRKEEKLSADGMTAFEKAKGLEKDGKFKEALETYKDLLKKYPNSDKAGIMTIRAASLYTRLKQYDAAAQLYKQVVKRYAGKKESYIAQILLFKLQEMSKLLEKTNTILASYVDINKKNKKELQETLYKLGTINLQLLNMDEAAKFFARSSSVEPSTELAAKAKFNAAWAKKEVKNMKESTAEFEKLAAEKPKSSVGLNSLYQVADIRQKEGRYQEAIDIYVKIADENKGRPIAALCLFQASASYLYDLNDSEKAKELIGRLSKEYGESPYAKFLLPGNPIGLFVTYLVPRATRVVTWRAGGLLAVCGYSGPIAQFRINFNNEDSFNTTLNDWLRRELPDTIGNLYVDIAGAKVTFNKGNATGEGRITMGKFNVRGEAEGHLELAKDGAIALVLTKAYLEKVPIPPMLINSSFNQLTFMIKKHFPIIVTGVHLEKNDVSIEGYGSKRMLLHLKKPTEKLLGVNVEVEDISDKKKEAELYRSFSAKFPENDFSPITRLNPEDLFSDFFTRMYLYLGFKLLETVKDTKLDYQRSVRTLGALDVKKIKYKVSYKEGDVNASFNRLVKAEFPWLLDNEYLFDIKGLEVHFKNNGDIEFSSIVCVGKTSYPIVEGQVEELRVEGRAAFDIDKESKIPRLVYKNLTLNGKPFPVEKLNLVSLRCLNILKDGHMPFGVETLEIADGTITINGQGAEDFIQRIFSDPYLFVIFQVRECDLWAAGIRRLKRPGEGVTDYWKGRRVPR